jgi:hypothetical protein
MHRCRVARAADKEIWLGRGLPARASLSTSIAISAMRLGLWFSAAFSINGLHLLSYLSILSVVVVLFALMIALIQVFSEGQ